MLGTKKTGLNAAIARRAGEAVISPATVRPLVIRCTTNWNPGDSSKM
jgi:hypothetical protein